jgi:hypothetical protein
VQRLRHRSQSAGLLKSSPQQTVSNDGDAVVIAPPPSQVIYVPAYDPWCIYGPWPYPSFAPYYFGPWAGYCGPADYLFAWDFGILLPWSFWEWGYFDWHHRWVGIHRDRYDRFHSGHGPEGDVWRHERAHRAGVPYRDQRNVQRFQPERNGRQSFRGYESEPSHRAPPAFDGFGSGRDARFQSQRGMSSLHGMSGGGSHGGPHR